MPFRHFRLPVALVITALALGCAAASDSAPGESAGSASWEPGEWSFDAELDPWPAPAGTPVTLRAIASVDDYDQSFTGSVSYKLASSSTPDEWVRMSHVGSDQGDMIYESRVTLPEETVGIHFLISRTNDGTTHELTDWSIDPG